MPIHGFVLASALASQIPQAAVDRSWGQLVQLPHFTGSWRVEIDGHTFEGDWAVVDTAPSDNQFTYRRWIHLLSSRTGAYCAIPTEEPERVYCRDATHTSQELYLPVHTDAMASDAPLDRHVWTNGIDHPRRGGWMRSALQPTSPTLSQEQMVFGRLHRTDLASTLGATVERAPTRLVLHMPFKTVIPRAGASTTAFDQDVVEYEATIRIGPSPADIVIESRATGRSHVEACRREAYHGSCMGPVAPTCVEQPTASHE